MYVKSKQIFLILLLLLGLVGLVVGKTVLAQSSAGFDLRWHVIGNGGGESGSAGYRVNGTLGQSLAGPPPATSAGFAVSSGYWLVGAGYSTAIYLPVVFRN